MKVDINLPCRIEVTDYYEFSYIQETLRKVIPGIKVIEIGFTGNYQGVAYLGRKRDVKVQRLIREIEKESDEFLTHTTTKLENSYNNKAGAQAFRIALQLDR